ncbi:MAG: amidohydrolase family protein, partial [Spirochaetota bacterium]
MMAAIYFANANILTMDDAGTRAKAMVVEGEEILFVGDEAGAARVAGPGAERRDLGGRTMIPGFNDNHLHAVILGDHDFAPNLGGLDSEAIVELLRERWKDEPPGRILMAFNWDYPACPNPRKEVLDAAFPDNPVILSQFSGHAQWLNTVSLEALGISKGSRDPARGQVLRDGDGEPTGIVRDLGDTVLSKKRFAKIFYDREQRESRLDSALATFRRFGITSVQDNTWFPQPLASFARYLREGRLSARFTAWSMGRRAWTTPAMRAAFALGRPLGLFPPDWIRPGPVKYFLDGAFSTKTACLCEPYSDGEGAAGGGGLCEDVEAPKAELEYLARHRLQGAFHIIGDRGIQIFLDSVEEVARRHRGLGRLRWRIEHAQLIRAEDIGRIRDLDILIAAQPSALGSPDKDDRLLGHDRALRAYPYRSLLDAGVRLSFGSDIPGESTCDPILSIDMAVNREGGEAIAALEAI